MLLAQVARNHDLALRRHRCHLHESHLTAKVRRQQISSARQGSSVGKASSGGHRRWLPVSHPPALTLCRTAHAVSVLRILVRQAEPLSSPARIRPASNGSRPTSVAVRPLDTIDRECSTPPCRPPSRPQDLPNHRCLSGSDARNAGQFVFLRHHHLLHGGKPREQPAGERGTDSWQALEDVQSS